MAAADYRIIRRDLSVARSGVADRITVPFSKIHILEAPAAFTLRIGGSDAEPFPIAAGRMGDIPRCSGRIGEVIFENEAGEGVAVLMMSDDIDPRFLASAAAAGGASEQVTSALIVDFGLAVRDLLKAHGAAEGGQLNANMISDAAEGSGAQLRLGIASVGAAATGYIEQQFYPEGNVIAGRHNVAGAARNYKNIRARFCECDVKMVAAGGAAGVSDWAVFGWWNARSDTGAVAPFGIGFAVHRSVNDNWHCAAMDRSGAAPAFQVGDRAVWVNTGISALAAYNSLRVVHGMRDSVPVLQWWINGELVHELEGPWATDILGIPGAAYLIGGPALAQSVAGAGKSFFLWSPPQCLRAGFTTV